MKQFRSLQPPEISLFAATDGLEAAIQLAEDNNFDFDIDLAYIHVMQHSNFDFAMQARRLWLSEKFQMEHSSQ